MLVDCDIMLPSVFVDRICNELVTKVLEDDGLIDDWVEDDIDEAVCYARLFVLEALVDTKFMLHQLANDKNELTNLDKDRLEECISDGIDMVRTFGRGY